MIKFKTSIFSKWAKKFADKILKEENKKLSEENEILTESAQLWEAHQADQKNFYQSFQFELLYPNLLPTDNFTKFLPWINTALLIIAVILIIKK